MTKKISTDTKGMQIVKFALGYMIRIIWALVTGFIFMLLTRVLHYEVIIQVEPASYASSVVIMLMVIFICEGISKAINFDTDDYEG